MSDDKEDDEKDLPKVGGNPSQEVANTLVKEQRKKKQAEFKTQMVAVQKAAEVFMLEVTKAEEIYAEIGEIKPFDFNALRKQFNL